MRTARWRWDNVPLPEAHLVALGAAAIAHWILPVRLPISRGAARLVGGSAIAAGTGLAAWGVSSASEAEVSVDHPAGLVTTGAFAISRNPMYQGWSIAVAGMGIATRSPWVLAASAIGAAATHRGVLDEEAALARSFGEAFATYAATTPRYLATADLADAVARVTRTVRRADVSRDRRRR
jgi:protein-S-isoprenylcysteine O-methyltransferase Ste14